MEFVFNDNDHGMVNSDTDKWGKDGPQKGCLSTVVALPILLVATGVIAYVTFALVVPAVQSLWLR